MPTAGARKAHYMQIAQDQYIQLNLVAGNYDGGLDTVLGMQESEPADPTHVIGTGFTAALKRGAVPLRLVYKAANGKNQTAKVLCSPATADTVFNDAIGQSYAGKPIVEVRFPRRRVYTW